MKRKLCKEYACKEHASRDDEHVMEIDTHHFLDDLPHRGQQAGGVGRRHFNGNLALVQARNPVLERHQPVLLNLFFEPSKRFVNCKKRQFIVMFRTWF